MIRLNFSGYRYRIVLERVFGDFGFFEAGVAMLPSLLKNVYIDEFISLYAHHSCSVFAVYMQEDEVLWSCSTA